MIIPGMHTLRILGKRPGKHGLHPLLVDLGAQPRLFRRGHPLGQRLDHVQDERVAEHLEETGAADVFLVGDGEGGAGCDAVEEGAHAGNGVGCAGGDHHQLTGDGHQGCAEDGACDEGRPAGGEGGVYPAGGVRVDGGAVDDELGCDIASLQDAGDHLVEGGIITDADEDEGGVVDGLG